MHNKMIAYIFRVQGSVLGSGKMCFDRLISTSGRQIGQNVCTTSKTAS